MCNQGVGKTTINIAGAGRAQQGARGRFRPVARPRWAWASTATRREHRPAPRLQARAGHPWDAVVHTQSSTWRPSASTTSAGRWWKLGHRGQERARLRPGLGGQLHHHHRLRLPRTSTTTAPRQTASMNLAAGRVLRAARRRARPASPNYGRQTASSPDQNYGVSPTMYTVTTHSAVPDRIRRGVRRQGENWRLPRAVAAAPITMYAPEHKVAKEYREVTREIIARGIVA